MACVYRDIIANKMHKHGIKAIIIIKPFNLTNYSNSFMSKKYALQEVLMLHHLKFCKFGPTNYSGVTKHQTSFCENLISWKESYCAAAVFDLPMVLLSTNTGFKNMKIFYTTNAIFPLKNSLLLVWISGMGKSSTQMSLCDSLILQESMATKIAINHNTFVHLFYISDLLNLPNFHLIALVNHSKHVSWKFVLLMSVIGTKKRKSKFISV